MVNRTLDMTDDGKRRIDVLVTDLYIPVTPVSSLPVVPP